MENIEQYLESIDDDALGEAERMKARAAAKPSLASMLFKKGPLANKQSASSGPP